jgi:catenin beta 1
VCCLITLRNLSDAATKINGLEGLIENLIKLLSLSNEVIATLAAG